MDRNKKMAYIYNNMKYFITGGAGFIGSHLVDALIKKNKVIVYDNLSSGSKNFIAHHFTNKNFKFIKGDILNKSLMNKSIKGCDFVFHLAANPDISKSVKDPNLDFEQGTKATFNVLEAMRKARIKKIAFSSSSTVFGETKKIPTPEDYGPLFPISTYGASKLACEGLISSYVNIYGFTAWIFRFANVIGGRATHGIIDNFIKQIQKNKNELVLLSDGTPKKSYIHVKDCISAMLFCVKNSKEKLNIFNLGTNDWIEVKEIAEIFLKEAGLSDTKIIYGKEKRGWKGDVPKMLLANKKIINLGWKQKYGSKKAVIQGIKENLHKK